MISASFTYDGGHFSCSGTIWALSLNERMAASDDADADNWMLAYGGETGELSVGRDLTEITMDLASWRLLLRTAGTFHRCTTSRSASR
jgi:hypothetical protein